MKTLNNDQVKLVSGGTDYNTPGECTAGRESGDLTIREMRDCIIETSSGGTYTKED